MSPFNHRPGAAAMPAEAPIAMPLQALKGPQAKLHRVSSPGDTQADTRLLRVLVGLCSLGISAALIYEMHAVLALSRLTPLEILMLAFFACNVTWIVHSTVLATVGFVHSTLRSSRISRPSARALRATASSEPSQSLVLNALRRWPGLTPVRQMRLQHRTAILIPTYNEDPASVFGCALATAQALADAGQAEHFALFVISDTTDPLVWLQEESAWLRTQESTAARCPIYYRRRFRNSERKAGNVAEWLRHHGADYAHFIVYDADSLMAPRTLIRMAWAMEHSPSVGLLQTVPRLLGQRSLFARLQQFANQVHGPLAARGLALFSGDAGNFWGHNAILRTEAFAQCAGLPHLSGSPPWGGHILSHDFVEAALLRRGGWAVVIDPTLAGTWEQSPPSLVDFAIRDRRWCQGNLQHARVISAHGLHPMNRLHMLNGIMAYLASPLWLGFLVAGLLLALQAQLILPEYFSADSPLFPTWPVIDAERALRLFVITMAILLLPRLLSLTTLFTQARARRQFGGSLRLGAGVLTELIISSLLAPVMMLMQSKAVQQILLGQDSGWNPQSRQDGRVAWRDLARKHARHTLIGLVVAAMTWFLSPALMLWLSPALLGLTLSIPLSGWTSRPVAWMERLGVLGIPQERRPHPMQERTERERDFVAAAIPDREQALKALIEQPALWDLHERQLPEAAAEPHDPAQLEVASVMAAKRSELAQDITTLARSLSRAEMTALLSQSALFAGLHRFRRQVSS